MKLNKNIAVSESGFIFNPVSGDSFSTNLIGQDILLWVQKGKERKEILDLLEEKYQAERATLEKDLLDFFQMLESYQLVENDGKA